MHHTGWGVKLPTLTLNLIDAAHGKKDTRIQVALEGFSQESNAECNFEFNFDPPTQEAFRWYIEDYPNQESLVNHGVARGIDSRLQRLGEDLFSKVFLSTEGTKHVWETAVRTFEQVDLRIVGRPKTLSTIPWELMRDPHNIGWLALRSASFSRRMSSHHNDVITQDKIRVLLVTSRPDGVADIGYRVIGKSLIAIQESYGKLFEVELLRSPTFSALARALEKARDSNDPYSIVHFDGHGIWPAEPITSSNASNPDLFRGYAIFEDPQSPINRQTVDGTRLGSVLVNHGVKALVLNSCRSAHSAEFPRASDSETADEAERREKASRSFGDEVALAGVPAVIAMRFNIQAEIATAFCENFYASLLSGEAFSRAVTAARRKLARYYSETDLTRPSGNSNLDWLQPITYSNADIRLTSAQIASKAQPSEAQSIDRFPAEPRHGFVGRDNVFFSLDRTLSTSVRDSNTCSPVLLYGMHGIGTTATAVAFARWFVSTGGIRSAEHGSNIMWFTEISAGSTVKEFLASVKLPAESRISSVDSVNDKTSPQIPDTEQVRRDTLLDYLSTNKVIWIWDAFQPSNDNEINIEFRALLEQICATGTLVIMTSCDAQLELLGELPARIRLTPMAGTEIRLLAEAVSENLASDPRQSRVFSSIIIRTYGHPAALITALANVHKASRVLSPTFMRDLDPFLGNRPVGYELASLLKMTISVKRLIAKNEKRRQQLAHMYFFGSSVEAGILEIIGRLPGKLSPAAFRGLSRDDAIQILDELSSVGLASCSDPGLYDLHPWLAGIVLPLLTEQYPDHESYEKAVAAFTGAISLLVNMASHQTYAVLILQPIYYTLMNAFSYALQHGLWEDLIGTMGGLRLVLRHWGERGEWAALVRYAGPSVYDNVTIRPLPGRQGIWSMFLDFLTDLAVNEGDWSEREAFLESARKWDETRLSLPAAKRISEGDENSESQYLAWLAVDYLQLGTLRLEQRSSETLPLLERALELSLQAGLESQVCDVYITLARAHFEIADVQDFDEAELQLHKALEICRSGDLIQRANILRQRGRLLIERLYSQDGHGQVDHLAHEGIEAFLQARQITPASAITERAKIDQGLGTLHLMLGEVYPALEHFRGAYMAWLTAENPLFAGECVASIARAYALIPSESATALEYYSNALIILRACGPAAEGKIEDLKAFFNAMATVNNDLQLEDDR